MKRTLKAKLRPAAAGQWLLCPVCGQEKLALLCPDTWAVSLRLYCRDCKRSYIADIQEGSGPDRVQMSLVKA